MATQSNTAFNKDISMEIKQDEELLWQGKPQKASFVLSKSIQMMPIALIWLCFDGFAIYMISRAKLPASMLIFLIIFFAFHLLPVWIWISTIIKSFKNYKNTEYAFTSERIILRDNDKLTSYYYYTLRYVHVKVGLIDRIFKVGDILISGNRSVTLFDIDSPYLVSQKLEQFIEDANAKFAENAHSEDITTEFEEYFESDNDNDSKGVGGFLDTRSMNFSSKKNNTRYTSTKMPDEQTYRTQEDEYLDNILDSIDKKDEF